jgi:hypothetical protein
LRVKIKDGQIIMKKNEQSTSPRKFHWPSAVLAGALFLLIGVAICVLIYATKTEPASASRPLTQLEHDLIRGGFAAVVVVGLILVLLARRLGQLPIARVLKPAMKVGAVILVVGACLMYFYTARGLTRRHYLNFHDMFHYFLGCKYHEETGYYEFYRCLLKADAESEHPHWRPKDRARDLNTYAFTNVRESIENANCDGFTADRWNELKHDVDLFKRYSHRKVVTDHGYNGTPFSARVAGSLANLFTVEYESLPTAVFFDVMGLCLLFAVLSWGFGWRIAFLCALFHAVNFSDFYFHVSFFRYWWLVTLGISLAFLYKNRYGPAAVFMTASAMLNVFPLMFFGGIGLKVIHSLATRRKIAPPHKVFITWTVIATIVFGGISLLHTRPIDRYGDFFEKMGRHSAKLTTTRSGFKYNFMYRGETTQDLAKISYEEKARDLTRIKTPYSILVGAILFVGMFLAFRLDDFKATIFLGFLLFFMLFSTVAYYYACASTLVMFWADDLRKNRGVLFVAFLFALLTLVHIAWQVSEFRGFVNNTVVTGIYTLYLGVVMIYLSVYTGLLGSAKEFVSGLFGALRKRSA